MNVAIDIDGTLDHTAIYQAAITLSCSGKPDVYWSLYDDTLTSAQRGDVGWHVYVVTGEISATPNRDGRLEQMRTRFPGIKYRELVLCTGQSLEDVARQKAEFCRNAGIDLFIDDRPEFISAVRRLSPDTVCLQVIT